MNNMGWIIGAAAVAWVVGHLVIFWKLMKEARRENPPAATPPKKAKNEEENPCESCQRWGECNGVDRPNCPLWRD